MQQFVFPAVFRKVEENSVTGFIPDLNLAVEADTIEEAFLFAKKQLRIFCDYAINLEEDILIPTKFERIAEKYPNKVIMLLDAIVQEKKK